MPSDTARRTAFTTHLKVAINKLHAEIIAETPDEEKILYYVEQVQSKFQKVEDITNKMQEKMEDEEEITADIDKFDLLENQVIEVKVKAKSYLEKLHKKAEVKTEETPLQQPVPPQTVSVKLPDATLQEFHGDEEKFPSFIDQFNALVDNNKHLTDIEKFGYLKGAAKVEVIQHYPLTEGNYKAALQKLKEEYGDEDLITKKHLNSLLDMSKRKKPSDNKELQEFCSFLETKFACLEALRRPVEQTNDMLITLIYRQLPKKLKSKVAQLDSAHNTVKAVMNIIKEYIKTTKRMEHREASDSDSDEDTYRYGKITNKRNKHQNKTERDRYTDEDDEDIPTSSAAALPILSQNRRPCPYCHENHSPLYCQKVTGITQRREILRRTNKCYNCLASGHRVSECRNEGRCRNCQGKHHSSICLSGQSTNINNQPQRSVPVEAKPSWNRKPASSNQGSTTSTSWKAMDSVLLELAQAEIRKPGGVESIPVNIFLDHGAQKSYIRMDVKNKLKLDTVHRDVLETGVFGTTKTQITNSELVTLQIEKGTFTKEIAVHVIEHICNPLPSFKINSRKLQELRGINLAHPRCKYEETHDISLLIGGDLYWQFVGDKQRRTSWGACAVHSKLGWLLSGPMSSAGASNTNVYLTTSKVIKSLNLDEVVLDKNWIKQKLPDCPPYAHLDMFETITESSQHMMKEVTTANLISSSRVIDSTRNHDASHQTKINEKLCPTRVSALSVLAIGDTYIDSSQSQKQVTTDINEVDDWFQFKMQTTMMDNDVELRWFWETEHIGIMPEEQEPSTLQQFLQTIKYNQDTRRYEVAFPCKMTLLEALPDNRHICEIRLQSLLTKLNKKGNEDMLNAYTEILAKQLDEEIIEEISQTAETGAAIHYLPHHCVVRKDKSTSAVRIVYDGSAKSNKKSLSLNQCLESGPSLVNNLAAVLLMFRMFLIGLVADISKAFLQLSLAEEDRDLTRFLWREKGNPNSPLKVYRFTRVPFGLTSSPFLLHATIIHHLNQYKEKYPEIITKLLKSFYVDDMVSGADTEEEAVQLTDESDKIMKEANMKLNKWNSNSKQVLETCSVADTAKTGESSVKVLGMSWNTEADLFEYNVQNIIALSESLKPSKRTVLRILQKVYDPLGFLAPYIITAKVFLQRLCRLDVSWDEEIPEDMMHEWEVWKAGLNELKEFKIPRSIKDNNSSVLELVGYSDASKDAYAAVVYIRCISKNIIKTNLVIAKSRVAPMKKQTIPRLELLGAVLLARLVAVVVEFLSLWKFTRVTYCTDSMNVFHWIQGSRKWNRYISKRVDEILNLSLKQQWRHCDGDLNPADYPTRGMTVEQLCYSQEWLHGPKCLSEPTFYSETKTVPTPPTDECLREELKSVHTLCATETTGLNSIIRLEDYSTLSRLYRVTAYVQMFISKRVKKKEVSFLDMKRQAERKWIIHEQMKHHKNLIPFLKGEVTKPIPNVTKQLDLFVDDDGVVRCSGRFKYANLSYNVKYPIFIPKESYLSTLIIKDRHRRVKHGGIKITLAEIRDEYWIPRGKRMIQDIIRNCVICRRITAKPFPIPGPPPLPSIRLSEMPPFTNTGVDFAGPLYCRERGRGKKGLQNIHSPVHMCFNQSNSSRVST